MPSVVIKGISLVIRKMNKFLAMVSNGYSVQKACGMTAMFLPDLNRKLQYYYSSNVTELVKLHHRRPKAPIVFNAPDVPSVVVTDEVLGKCQLIIGFCHEVDVDCEAEVREDELNYYVKDPAGPTYRISKEYVH